MSKNLVVVESPAKARTLKKYLGKGFEVLASYGHVRDLVPKSGAIDVANRFSMRYEPLKKNLAHVAAIAKAAKQADSFYLATDPDREGEAIAWHLCELLKEKKVLKRQQLHRIVFHEITKSAVLAAIAQPRDLSMDLVDAQQARRALDYLVGFNLSPLLWKKIRYGLSAGRVQSPALRMIVTREEEIANFVAREYWSIVAISLFDQQQVVAKLIEYQGVKLEQFSFTQQLAAEQARDFILHRAQGKLIVVKLDKKQRSRKPSPPFTTSTLQQEASRKLHFAAKRTMSIAQKLYEAGYITYMRTDSVNVSAEALTGLREVIVKKYGEKFLPKEINRYQVKSKNAQEAHEAIRPTDSSHTPESLANILSTEQAKLYELIWRRTVASQMSPALFELVAVDLTGGEGNVFRANGSTLIFAGFLAALQEVTSETVVEGAVESHQLPVLKVNDQLSLLEVKAEQHFTEPPPRYNEASLVKTLEEYDIGRPSTYASIIDTLISRAYVVLENRKFVPTDVGKVVNKFLTNHFTLYVDYQFTANLENELDEIASGKFGFLKLMKKFWQPFKQRVDEVADKVARAEITQEVLEEKCPKCGEVLLLKLGKNGNFIGCSAYPKCDYTAQTVGKDTSSQAETIPDRVCPKCNQSLQIKFGKYGKFIGCSSYPGCAFIEPLEKPKDTGVACPSCSQGKLLQRKSRYGKYFYACSDYPGCKYATWYEPIAKPCPKCGWKILTRKFTKRRGEEIVCPQKECGYNNSD